jgi:hypothetical protein
LFGTVKIALVRLEDRLEIIKKLRVGRNTSGLVELVSDGRSLIVATETRASEKVNVFALQRKAMRSELGAMRADGRCPPTQFVVRIRASKSLYWLSYSLIKGQVHTGHVLSKEVHAIDSLLDASCTPLVE